MKRGAEHQLSKGDGSDEPEEVIVQESTSFQKADESVLATRKIRALPKRSPVKTANGLGASSDEAPSAPKFSGFTGFGVPTSKSDPFTFTPSQSPTTAIPPSPNVSPFSTTPAVAASASVATKTFASFLGNTASSPAPPPVTNVSDTKEPDAVALKYFKSLRGLNISFQSAMGTALQLDPFFDVSNLLERYKGMRINVQKEFDDKSGGAKDNAAANTTIPAISSSIDKPPETPSSSMPVPPASFAGFGGTSLSASSSSTATGFIPKIDSTPSKKPVSFFPSVPAGPTLASTTSAPPPPIKPFDFTTPPQVSLTTSPPPAPIHAGFKFTPTQSSFSKTVDTASPPKADSGSKSSQFETSSTSSSISSLFGPSPSSNTGSPFIGFGSPSLLGTDSKTSTNVSSSPNLFGANTTSPPSLFGGAFGSGAAIKTSPFGGFGKTSSTISNPVGFAFGMPPKAPTAGDAAVPAAAHATPFSLSAPPTQQSSTATTPEFGDTDGTTTPVQEDNGDPLKIFQTKTHDVEGEGEENEETTHAVRTKVFKLSKSKDDSSWVEMGIGVLRLKKHKERDLRRILLRNSNTGKITINFNIYAELNPTQTGKFISFVGHEGSIPVMFKLRLKSEEDAVELKKSMDREIASVKTKSG